MNREKRNNIIKLVEPHLSSLGYECVEAELDSEEKALRIFIDGPNGIVMDDCLKANRLLLDLADVDAVVPNDFRLEVSSPGIERPLRTPEHFRKALGEQVKVKLTEALNDRRQAVGKLVEINDEGWITLELASDSWRFPHDLLQSANLVYDWNQL